MKYNAMTVLVTGSSGYIGRLICEILSKNSISFESCGRSDSDVRAFSLSALFDEDIPFRSIVFHAAFSFDLKDYEHNLNLKSLEGLIELCKKRDSKLVLIGSTSALNPELSDYSRIKREQEDILLRHKFGTIIQLGLVTEENNFFLKSIRRFSRLCLFFTVPHKRKLFTKTTFEDLEKEVMKSLNEPENRSFEIQRAFSGVDEFITFEELQFQLVNRSCRKYMRVPVHPLLMILRPFRRFPKVNRLYNSIKFIC